MSLTLALILKPLAALFVLTGVRFLALRGKPYLPQKWHAALYTPFTVIALEREALAKRRAQQRAIDAEVVGRE